MEHKQTQRLAEFEQKKIEEAIEEIKASGEEVSKAAVEIGFPISRSLLIWLRSQ